jgi:hypothetical protein
MAKRRSSKAGVRRLHKLVRTMALLSDPNWRLTMTLALVRELGFELGLDLDNSLLIEPPAAVTVEQIVELLRSCEPSLVQELQDEARRARRQFVGGPLNGRRHGMLGCCKAIPMKISRGRWAAYWIAGDYNDGRAFFVGYATSECKARRLALQAGPLLQL